MATPIYASFTGEYLWPHDGTNHHDMIIATSEASGLFTRDQSPQNPAYRLEHLSEEPIG